VTELDPDMAGRYRDPVKDSYCDNVLWILLFDGDDVISNFECLRANTSGVYFSICPAKNLNLFF
jgi:hypothetical protein